MTSSLVFSANRPTVISERFDDEVVIVNLQTGSYYSLEREAACVWAMLDEGCTELDLVDGIAQRYESSHVEIERGLTPFLDELQQEGLIITSIGNSEPMRGSQPTAGSERSTPRDAFGTPVLNKYTDMEELLLIDPIHEVDEMGWPSAARRDRD